MSSRRYAIAARLVAAVTVLVAAAWCHAGASYPVADTLTVLMRPINSVPAVVPRGQSFTIHCLADAGTTEWEASLLVWGTEIPLGLSDVGYHSSLERWVMRAGAPPDAPLETYDLVVRAAGIQPDTARNAVKILSAFADSFYIVHVTDTHLPTTMYWWEPGASTDSSSLEDYRAVMQDINLIDPAFVVLTGDVVNEGELEDFQGRRYFSRTKRLMGELTVPQYVVAGNHDVGGWDPTPPPDGEARRSWWRFFGWSYLDSPPPGDDLHTQNYAFDYGAVHFAGMEAYVNYDGWRYDIYGSHSFTENQLVWLQQDLAQAHATPQKVLFYHYDFQGQLDPGALDVDLYLWGHTHQDSETMHGDAWSIATDRVCDGHRAYRVIRFTPEGVEPAATLSAGTSGQSLSATFYPANDGSATEVSATVYNSHYQRFEHGLLRFLMSPDGAPYGGDGGNLFQALRTVDADGESLIVCYVRVDIQPRSAATVTVGPGAGCPGDRLELHPVPLALWPNPLRPGAGLWVSWEGERAPSAALYELSGRVVRDRVRLRSAGRLTYWCPWEELEQPRPGVIVLRVQAQDRIGSARIVLIP